jgi:hypothetical protein
MPLMAPTAILGDDKFHVRAMTCIRTELGEPDASAAGAPCR